MGIFLTHVTFDATYLPFNIFIFQDDLKKIYVVGQTDGSQNPEDGVSIKAWEWFRDGFLFTCMTGKEN